MFSRHPLVALAGGLLLALALPLSAAAQDEGKPFYWISHGDPADPVWTYYLDGANEWAADTGQTVNTSFWSGDVALQQEAIRSAIAAGAAGIVTSVPDPGSLVEVTAEARAAGIPVISFNTDDPGADFNAFVGNDLVDLGRQWAQYLVDHELVSEGDFVWMPVEIPGATYGVDETRGVASVFDPLGIEYEVTDATYEQATVIDEMVNYLTANRDKIDAMIGLGDLVTGSVQRVWDQVGVAPGEIPVVGWGNSIDTTQAVLDGYVNAAMWADPQAISYMGLSLAALAASGFPPGFDVMTGTLYEADTAQLYDDIMSGS
jgi:simple sugar transport system substrate-binding protein